MKKFQELHFMKKKLKFLFHIIQIFIINLFQLLKIILTIKILSLLLMVLIQILISKTLKII